MAFVFLESPRSNPRLGKRDLKSSSCERQPRAVAPLPFTSWTPQLLSPFVPPFSYLLMSDSTYFEVWLEGRHVLLFVKCLEWQLEHSWPYTDMHKIKRLGLNPCSPSPKLGDLDPVQLNPEPQFLVCKMRPILWLPGIIS